MQQHAKVMEINDGNIVGFLVKFNNRLRFSEGADHPNIVASMSSLAGHYMKHLNESSFENRTMTLGADHPNMVASMSSQALVHERQSLYADLNNVCQIVKVARRLIV